MKISASRKQLFISTQITLLLMIKACGTVPPANEDRGTSHLDETVTAEMRREKYGTIIGIDLGTTYSCVGVFRNGKVEILSNSASSRTTPSTLSWDKEHDLQYIGEDAINRQVFDPINTIYDVKRIIGRDYNDSALQRDIINWPFHVVNRNNKPHISFSTGGKEAKEYPPELISAMVLGRLKEIAENYLGRNISYAVITVPAYFSDAQRQATKDAGEIAELNVVRILNEPTAAAIAYGIQNKHTRRNILVFDLGGGTFDVSILQIEKSDFKVLAVNGDTHLGGADFDQRLIDFLLKRFEDEKGKFNIRKNHRAMQRLRIEVEKAKRTLSSEIIATINIEKFFEGVDFHDRITREKFEQLNMDYFKAAIAIVKKVIIDAKLAASDMDEIVLVGGSTRIPKLKSMLLSEFPGVPVNRDIDPDEAVAYGATYLAAAIGGEISTTNLRFTDVNPISLGISLNNDIFEVVIPRNTFIPVTESVTDFTTSYDNQKNALFPVYEGERPIASENHFLGQFVLENIQIAMKGKPRFKVTMELDLNGILHVSATDMQTASTKSITIRDDDKRLSPEDVKRSLEEAKRYADRDNNIKKLINDINKYGLELENVKTLLRRKLVHCKHLTAEELALQNLAEKSSDWLLKVDQLDQLSIKNLKKNKENFDRMLHPLFDQLRDKHCLPSCGEIKASYGSELVDTKKKLNDINSNCGKLTFPEREILKVIEWSSDWLLGLKHDDAQCVEKIQENKTNLDKVLQPIADRLLNSDSCSRSKSLQYQALSAEIMRRMAKAFGRHGLSTALLGEVIDIVALLMNELSTWELGVVAMVVGAAACAVYSMQLKYRRRRRRRAYERNSRIRQPTPVEDTDAMSDGTEDENATLEMRSEYERFRPEEQQTAERRRHREES